MINPIKIRLRKPQSTGIFHDSRGDSAQLRDVCNVLIAKVNELIDTVNQLEGEVKKMREDNQ